MKPQMYERFERLEDSHWWFEGRRRIIREVLRRHLLPRQQRRILDVGCGTGGMFPLLAEFGAVEGAEYSADARERAARRFPGHPVHPCELPRGLPAGEWDALTAFDVLEHVEDSIGALTELRSRLVFDGQLVVTVPAFQFLWSQHDDVNEHKRRYTRTQLVSHLSSAGLRVTWVSYFNSLLFPAVVAARFLENALPSLFRPKETDSNLEETPALLNQLLTQVFASERLALGLTRLPAGVSLIAVAQRG